MRKRIPAFQPERVLFPQKINGKYKPGNDPADTPEKGNRTPHREIPGDRMVYPFNGKDYIVTAAAYDGYGYQNLEELQNTLCLLFVAGLSMLFGAGYLLARTSLKPIRDIVSEAERITASEISRRLPVKNRNDELGELSTTFNSLLERLEVSFNAQKMFVSNVSHEMRTPLAALTAELDLALQKERTPEQYRDTLNNALRDAHQMARN